MIRPARLFPALAVIAAAALAAYVPPAPRLAHAPTAAETAAAAPSNTIEYLIGAGIRADIAR